MQDVLLCIDTISLYIDGFTLLSQFKNDLKTIDSVERRLAIIGEAIFKADKLDANLPITDKKKMIGLRHILVHDYDLINYATIWLICKSNLSLLKEEVTNILKTFENS